jgi:gliding motility-associated-like protein
LPNATIQVRNYIFTKEAIANLRQQNVLRDSVANATERSFCYQVSYRDRCDKTPATNPTVCTIHLNAQEDALRWTGASPFVQAVQNYAVERLDANGQIVRTYNIGTAIQWDIDPNDTDQEVFYRIKATSVTGQTSISNTVKIVRTVQLIVPEAFSPNNDQINDVLELKGQYLKRASFTVFDRWGEVVFFTEDWRKSWDGKSKEGLPLPNGVYSYYLEAVDNKENAFQRRGAVYLLR